jgi:hypothetical protein
VRLFVRLIIFARRAGLSSMRIFVMSVTPYLSSSRSAWMQ